MPTRREFCLTAAAAALAPVPLAAQETLVLPPEYVPQEVRVRTDLEPGQIIVDTPNHFLYHVTREGRAIRYAVGVGRAGLSFRGVAVVERKAEWPSWRPTDEMIERDPVSYAQFSEGVPGGVSNPLGARALYLYQNGIDTYYRIHGTNQPTSIGQSVSNGCIRMINSHVMHLYERVPLGTQVTVV